MLLIVPLSLRGASQLRMAGRAERMLSRKNATLLKIVLFIVPFAWS
jgi:hypothetical protein